MQKATHMTATATALHEQWETQSYIRVPQLITAAEAERLRVICEDILRHWRSGAMVGKEATLPVQAPPSAIVMRHLNHPDYFVSPDGKQRFAALMDLIADPRILSAVTAVLDDEPMFFCTSLFFNPLTEGRDGNWHRDSQFITNSEEDEKTFLLSQCATQGVQLQIALVPSEDSEVVPGSHLRWDTPAEYHIRKGDGGKHKESNDMPGTVRVALQPGDAVAFNPFALHRGRYHTDRLRRTIMLTYSATSGTHELNTFTNQPWFRDPAYLAPLSERTRRYFAPFVEKYAPLWPRK